MCGIAGEVDFLRGVPHPDVVARMCEALVHRGPDELGQGRLSQAALGIRRLKIVGLKNGSQPVSNPAGTVLCVFNGEIYNHLELRKQLEARGHVLPKDTDAQVIPYLYDEYGLDFVEKLTGMFAIALYDSVAQRLILVRDRFGKKPLFYTHDMLHKRLIFASELQALVTHPAVPSEINLEAVDQFLSHRFVPAPNTIYRAVRKVLPGTVLVADASGVSTFAYWQARFDSSNSELGQRELRLQLREHLLTAVERRLTSEVELGGMLSGGLDSSLIVALMSARSSRPVHTFSVGFQEPEFDESAFARQVAEHCGAVHHHSVIDVTDASRLVERMVRHFGEPFAFPSAIASFKMYELAAKHVKVVLGGDGADELFAGYNRYKLFQRLPELPEDPRDLARIDRELLASSNGEIARSYQAVFTDGLRNGLKQHLYRPELVESLPSFPANYLAERFASTNASAEPLDRVMQVDCGFWLRDAQLVKIDIASMASSLEVRCPMLDDDLVRFASRLGPKHKLVGDCEKAILKDVARELLPRGVVDRRKQELAVPLERWLLSGMRDEIQGTLTSERCLSRGYFEPARLRAFASDLTPAKVYPLWTLYMLEKWHRYQEASC